MHVYTKFVCCLRNIPKHRSSIWLCLPVIKTKDFNKSNELAVCEATNAGMFLCMYIMYMCLTELTVFFYHYFIHTHSHIYIYIHSSQSQAFTKKPNFILITVKGCNQNKLSLYKKKITVHFVYFKVH